MKRKPTIGTISEGTLRAVDLVPAFVYELRCIRGALPRHIYEGLRSWESNGTDEEKDANGMELIEALTDALSEHAPPYFYFGAHHGDGADFGFWLGELDEFDGYRVSDTSEVPDDYIGEVLHVNDHGNTTLYSAMRGVLSEIWAIV